MTDPRANPIAGNPFHSRDDVAAAVDALFSPLLPHVVDDSRVRLGSFGAAFEQASAELEGFARPLYGIVPLVAGGGSFAHWDRIVRGLAAGSDPEHPGYWGAVCRDGDQRMVEQAAIGLALAFCPEHVWDPLDRAAQDRLVRWLGGIVEFEPVANNWQFFRVLVALGLERVGRPADQDVVDASLDLLDTWRRGDHWYVDGDLGNVDYYVPMAFHTYGLLYAAANDLGLGDDVRAAAFRERARGFADDFVHWFGPDGAAVAMGRSLTYRFAAASFWAALAWADVEPAMGWGAVRGMLARHLRWWSDKPISDRDGVLSVGYAYDNRAMRESYNSAGSPYWCMKAFAALGAPADHPFWTEAEADHPVFPGSTTALPDAGWVTHTDASQTVALVANPGVELALPEQVQAKYRKFAYSSRFALGLDVPDFLGRVVTDSTLAVTDAEGNRRVRFGIDRGAVIETDDRGPVARTTWSPFDGVRIISECWFDDGGHHRRHDVTTRRAITLTESGFALGCDPAVDAETVTEVADAGEATARTWDGTSTIRDLDGERAGAVYTAAVDANLVHPHTAIPVLRGSLDAGRHVLRCFVTATPP